MSFLWTVDESAEFVHVDDPMFQERTGDLAEAHPLEDWRPADGQHKGCKRFRVRGLSKAEILRLSPRISGPDEAAAQAAMLELVELALLSVDGEPAQTDRLVAGAVEALANLIILVSQGPTAGRRSRLLAATLAAARAQLASQATASE